jgi:hypothetical protein
MNNQSYGELAHWGLVDDDPTCLRCDGAGEILAECFEDTCCCADPEEHGYITCPDCLGRPR